MDEIKDVLNSTGVVPSFIDASSLVVKRLAQVSDLVDVIRNGGRDHNPKTVIQRLPRHMRRRAMSHNIKRLPRKHHDFASRIASKTKHRKKPPSRFHRRRPRNLQKEYTKRSNNGNRWLQSHIWHAKRFQMIKLWGFKIPLRCYHRGVRPFMRAAKKDIVIFDDSYCRLLRFRFTSDDQLAIFKKNYSSLRNSKYCSLKDLSTSSSGIQQIFSIQSESSNDAILSIHPLFFEKPLELLTKLTGLSFRELDTGLARRLGKEYGNELPLTAYESDNCLVTDETNLYSVFSLYGEKVIPHLFRRLNLVKDDELELDEFKEIHEQWRSFGQNGSSINDLPNGSCFSLLVEDPRLSSMENSNQSISSPSTSTQVKQSNLLFHQTKLRKILSSAITEEKLNQLKSTRVGSIKLKHYKVPVIVSFWNWCSTSHFKLLLPASTSRTFFSYFYRSGFRVGSLADRFILCNEISDCAYPFLWLPLTIEKPLYRWKRYCKFKEATFENCGKWNSLKNWSYVIDNPNGLARLQSFIESNAVINDSDLLQLTDALVPVRIIPFGNGRITDDSLIYEWQNESSPLLNGSVESSDDEDPNKFFDDSESEDESPAKKKVKISNNEEIIGRLAIAEESHYHGRVEALGYIELKAFLGLRNSEGKVRVRNPNSTKFVNAHVKTIYSQ